MVDPLLCLSVVQNTTSLIEQSFRILGRLRTAYIRQQNIPDVLLRHENELKSVKTIIGIIEDEEELQIDTVTDELIRVKEVQTKLKELLVSLDPPKTRGKFNQIARQLVQGSTDERKLSAIMADLGNVKATLLVCIQVAQVGVLRTMKKEFVADAEVIQRIHEGLKEKVDNCKGLRIARLLKGRSPSEDGTVPITAEELETLNRIESEDSSEDETLFDESEVPPRDLPRTTGRYIDHNKATVESVQINAAVENDPWEHMDRLYIRHNEVAGRAVQINHATTMDVLRFMRDWQKHNIAASCQER